MNEPKKYEDTSPNEREDDADRPNLGDPGPEQPKQRAPIDPATDPRIPHDDTPLPRGV